MRPSSAARWPTRVLVGASGVGGLVLALFALGAFDATGFPPRWFCGTWSAPLGWTHIVSDVLIWLAYTAIPVVIVYYLRKRTDAKFPRIWWLFAAFILACGTVHLVEATIFWWPIYRLSAVVKATTAVVSWATVIALFPVIPKALALPSRVADLKALIQHAPTAMIVADSTGQIALANTAAEQLFGYDRDELVGRSVDILTPDRIRREHPSLRESYFNNPTVTELGQGRELSGVRKDGHEIPVEVGLTPLELRGGPAVLACIVDQTLQKKRRERELAELSQAMSLREVLGGLAHELNTPVQQIVTWTAVTRLYAPPPEMRESLDGLTAAAEDVGRIIHQLRDAVIRREAVEEPVDLNQLIRDTLALMHREVSGVRTALSDDAPTVTADPVQLQLVLSNLIRNAHQSGGPITVSTERDNGEVTCRVVDQGHGFTVDPERLFEPFYSTKSAGLGMGLTVSQAIVRRYGGRLTATALERGARFEFTLRSPRTPPA